MNCDNQLNSVPGKNPLTILLNWAIVREMSWKEPSWRHGCYNTQVHDGPQIGCVKHHFERNTSMGDRRRKVPINFIQELCELNEIVMDSECFNVVLWGQGQWRSQEYVIHLRWEDREVTMCLF